MAARAMRPDEHAIEDEGVFVADELARPDLLPAPGARSEICHAYDLLVGSPSLPRSDGLADNRHKARFKGPPVAGTMPCGMSRGDHQRRGDETGHGPDPASTRHPTRGRRGGTAGLNPAVVGGSTPPGSTHVGWQVERPDPEQPPRLVWWSDLDDLVDAVVLDVDDILFAIEERTFRLMPDEAERAIVELCALVERSARKVEP